MTHLNCYANYAHDDTHSTSPKKTNTMSTTVGYVSDRNRVKKKHAPKARTKLRPVQWTRRHLWSRNSRRTLDLEQLHAYRQCDRLVLALLDRYLDFKTWHQFQSQSITNNFYTARLCTTTDPKLLINLTKPHVQKCPRHTETRPSDWHDWKIPPIIKQSLNINVASDAPHWDPYINLAPMAHTIASNTGMLTIWNLPWTFPVHCTGPQVWTSFTTTTWHNRHQNANWPSHPEIQSQRKQLLQGLL